MIHIPNFQQEQALEHHELQKIFRADLNELHLHPNKVIKEISENVKIKVINFFELINILALSSNNN